jgi:hypothetical protein
MVNKRRILRIIVTVVAVVIALALLYVSGSYLLEVVMRLHGR